MSSLLYLFLMLAYSDGSWVGFGEYYSNSTCSEICLGPYYLDIYDCDPTIASPSKFYTYDIKSDSCISPPCLRLSRYNVTSEQCFSRCSTCKRLWKHYKLKDECLSNVYLTQPEMSSDTNYTMAEGPIYKWVFEKGVGKCIYFDIFHLGMQANWYVYSGLPFESQKECEKRCPSVDLTEEHTQTSPKANDPIDITRKSNVTAGGDSTFAIVGKISDLRIIIPSMSMLKSSLNYSGNHSFESAGAENIPRRILDMNTTTTARKPSGRGIGNPLDTGRVTIMPRHLLENKTTISTKYPILRSGSGPTNQTVKATNISQSLSGRKRNVSPHTDLSHGNAIPAQSQKIRPHATKRGPDWESRISQADDPTFYRAESPSKHSKKHFKTSLKWVPLYRRHEIATLDRVGSPTRNYVDGPL